MQLLLFLASMFTMTTDLGFEGALTAYEFGPLRNLLPPWLAQTLEPLLGADEEHDPEYWRLLGTVGLGFLRHCIPIPGCMHILHNLNANVHGSLPYWDEFWEVLKLCSKLLSERGRRERFINECLLKVPGLKGKYPPPPPEGLPPPGPSHPKGSTICLGSPLNG